MKKVNLKELYYYIQNDVEVEVDDEVYNVLEVFKKQTHAYREKVRRNKSYYSLDYGNNIEKAALLKVKTPEELFYIEQRKIELEKAIQSLPKKQAERIILYFYYDMKVTEIARLQGVASSSVSESIMSGLDKLKKKFFKPY